MLSLIGILSYACEILAHIINTYKDLYHFPISDLEQYLTSISWIYPEYL